MNLYEFEGKKLFEKHGISTPKGVVVRRGDDVQKMYSSLGIKEVVVKAQVLSGKRGKNNGIKFCSSTEEVVKACDELFAMNIKGQYVAAVLIEEKLAIAEEHYLSITYDTNKKQPVLVYSQAGGVDIEEVSEQEIRNWKLEIRDEKIKIEIKNETEIKIGELAQQLWDCFLMEDTRVVEINPLVKTVDGRWIAADAKVAIDDDAFFRHEEWSALEPRTMLGRPATEREIAAKKIDEGEKYYQGTAGKYIEMEGDIATLFSSAGASISNMDALLKAGLKAANYTEYSGNPPREKVHQLTKIVLSKPGLKGLWIIGGVANFTNVEETFRGVIDALDELKPSYPIVVRRGGPSEKEGLALMAECAKRNNLNMKIFGKEASMSDTAQILAGMINK